MAKRTKKEAALTPEEKLQQALVPKEEQPYLVPTNWCWTYLTKGCAECKDSFRKPINASERANRMGKIPYFGATGQVGWIDDYLTEEELVLLGEDGAPFLDLLKDKAYLISGKAWVNNHAHILKSFYGHFGNLYVLHYLNVFNFTGYVNGTTRLKLTQASMDIIPVPLPPLLEQQRIVECIENLFAKLDEVKEKAQAVVDGYEDRKAAILHKAFTGELTAKWREVNHIDINGWQFKKLSETTIKIIDGDRGKNYPKKDEFSSEGYCIFLNAKNVTKNGFVFDECDYITQEKDKKLHNGRLERGDMVLTTRGTIGNVAVYDETIPYEHLRINSGMVIYRDGFEFSKKYLIWLYQSKLIKNQIRFLRTGTAQPQLPIKVMNALILPIPEINEQNEIVNLIDQMIEKEIQAKEAAESVLEKTNTLKKSILARAFRGELGTNDAADEPAVELLKRFL